MQILTYLPLAITIIGVLAGALGYFAKARGDSIIAYQEKENGAIRRTNADLEKTVAALTAERDSLKEQNETLRSLAQGSPQLVKLTGEVRRLATSVAAIVRKGSKNA